MVLAAAGLGWAGAAATQQAQTLVPRAVLKLIIDHPALAPYLHPEVAGRVPLVVSDHLLEPGVTPSKFGLPLRIVPDREVGTQPHIRILTFKIDAERERVYEHDWYDIYPPSKDELRAAYEAHVK